MMTAGVNNGTVREVSLELSPVSFDLPEHRIIYRAIQRVIAKGDVPDIPAVSLELGPDLQRVGGSAYLSNLILFPKTHNLIKTVRVLDAASRIRQLNIVVSHYHKELDDFDAVVLEAVQQDNVEEYLGNVLSKLEDSLKGQVDTGYTHISAYREIEERNLQLSVDGGVTGVYPCGLPSFQDFFFPRPETFGVLAGLSSRGKSSLALLLAIGTATQLKLEGANEYVSINELETPGEIVYRNCACTLSSVNSIRLKQGIASSEEMKRYRRALDFLDKLPIYFNTTGDQTVDEIRTQSLLLNLTTGKTKRLGILDFTELLSDKGHNDENKISNIGNKTRSMARELGSCELLLSQYSTEVLKTASMLGGQFTRHSGSLYHRCDVFMELYNIPEMLHKGDQVVPPPEFDPNLAWVIFRKNRGHDTGMFPMAWHRQYTFFHDSRLQTGQIFEI